MLPELREVTYVPEIEKSLKDNLVFVADIGGTNTNCAVLAWVRGRLTLLVSLHAKSKEIGDYSLFMQELRFYIKERYGYVPGKACIAAAGVITDQRSKVKPTNLSVVIDAHNIQQKAGFASVILINDFEAVACGIDLVAPQDMVCINKGVEKTASNKACIGAGTGFGKAALLWNRHLKRYLPFASEGGHADCAAQSSFDMALFEYIKKERMRTGGLNGSVSWEDVLSGRGLQVMYQFLQMQSYQRTACAQEIEQHGFNPDLISRYAHNNDMRCKDVFLIYARFYARCAKNFVLDTLATNGIYIAGGIAAKNKEIFQEPVFMEEFVRSSRQGNLLRDVPVYLVTDYNISLFGAAQYLNLYEQGII